MRAQRVKDALLTPQYELDIITPQNEAAPRRPISKISIQNFEKVENLNSRIWKIVVQGIHITKYLRICNPSREWQTFQIQIGRLGAGSGDRIFLETAFFGKAHFLDPKKAVSKKSRFPKKAV